MAKEISVVRNAAGATLYAVFRRISDNYVWNGSAFVAYVNGDVANYDVALTDGGGDLYTVDWPTSMDAGNYRVIVYEMAGATPAITDEPLKNYSNVYWSGAVASSGSSVTLSAYALATLAQVKQDVEEDGSDNDTAYTELINGCSLELERVIGRRILTRTYRQRYDGVGQRRLVLREYPAEVLRIAYGAGQALSLTYTGGIRANATIYRADDLDTTGGLRITSVATNGTATTNSLTFASYASVSALATAVNLVSGWTATVISNQPSADLNPGPLGDANGRTVYATYPDVDDYAYRVDGTNGIVTFNLGALAGWANTGSYGGNTSAVRRSANAGASRMPYGHQGILAEYTAGHSAVPADVNMVVRELIRNKIYELDVHPSITSLTLGHASAAFSGGDEDFVRSRLAHYIDHRNLVA